MIVDPYAELGVSPEAEPEVISGAYRALARKYHPDRNPDPDAAERMKRINEAHDILRDPQKRREYDRSDLERRRPTSSPPPAPPEPPADRKCGTCGATAARNDTLCARCRAAQLERQLGACVTLLVGSFTVVLASLHSLPTAVALSYLVASQPTGWRCYRRLETNQFGWLLARLMVGGGVRIQWLVPLLLCIEMSAVLLTPLDVARSAWELRRLRKRRRQ